MPVLSCYGHPLMYQLAAMAKMDAAKIKRMVLKTLFGRDDKK